MGIRHGFNSDRRAGVAVEPKSLPAATTRCILEVTREASEIPG